MLPNSKFLFLKQVFDSYTFVGQNKHLWIELYRQVLELCVSDNGAIRVCRRGSFASDNCLSRVSPHFVRYHDILH